MRHKIYLILLIVSAIVCLCSVEVFAASSTAPSVTSSSAAAGVGGGVDTIINAIKDTAKKVKDFAWPICIGLGFCSLGWNLGYGYMTQGRWDLNGLVVLIMRMVFVLAALDILINHGIVSSFYQGFSDYITSQLGTAPAGPRDLIETVFDLANIPANALNELVKKDGFKLGVFNWENDFRYVGAVIACGIGSFIALLAMFMAYITMIVTQAKLEVVIAFAVLAFGFTGSSFTKDIAMRGASQVISTSIELAVIYVLIAATKNVFAAFSAIVLNDWGDAFALSWQCCLAGVILAALFQQIPGVIAGMFGGVGGGGNALVGASMAMAAVTKGINTARTLGRGAENIGRMGGKIGRTGGKIGTKISTTMAGGYQAVREHMPEGSGHGFGFGGGAVEGIKNVGKGMVGAGKEAVMNRASSMREAISDARARHAERMESYKDSFLGRKHNNVDKG